MKKMLMTLITIMTFNAYAGNAVDKIVAKHVGQHDGYNNQTGRDCGVVVDAPAYNGGEYGITVFSSFGAWMHTSNDFKAKKENGLQVLLHKSTSGGGLNTMWGNGSGKSTRSVKIRFSKLGSMIEVQIRLNDKTIYCEL